jgi:glutamate dehydrogenase/leucine dehydrogenase
MHVLSLTLLRYMFHTSTFFVTEYTKNLQSMRLGRLTERFERDHGSAICDVLAESGINLTASQRARLEIGGSELGQVQSGLADTMTNSVMTVLKTAETRGLSMRVAAYVVALERIAKILVARGLFP